MSQLVKDRITGLSVPLCRAVKDKVLQVVGNPGPGDADRAADAIKGLFREAGWRSTEELVEQACAGAVVEQLPYPADARRPEQVNGWSGLPDVPIASVGPFGWLAEAVATRLAKTPTGCTSCGTAAFDRGLVTAKNTTGNNCPGQWADDPTCGGGGFLIGHPFAAAWSTVGAEREFVLVGGVCKRCLGHRNAGQGPAYGPCGVCGGTGARTDVKAIADGYQPDRPWRDEDTARVARFRVRAK